MIIKTANLIPLNYDKNQILLFKRAEKDEFYGTWCLPGGTINQGEKTQRGLEREIFEETRCKIQNLRFFREYQTFQNNSQIQSKYYTGNLDGKIIVNPIELLESKWFKLNSCLQKLDYSFNHKEIILDYLKYLK